MDKIKQASAETPVVLESKTESLELNLDLANIFEILVTRDFTLSFKNPTVGASHMVIFKQDATGGHTVTFDSGFIFATDDAKEVGETAEAVSVFTCLYSQLAQKLICTPVKQY
jgi:hypothetical protein